MLSKSPNPAHLAIAECAERLKGEGRRLRVITQVIAFGWEGKKCSCEVPPALSSEISNDASSENLMMSIKRYKQTDTTLQKNGGDHKSSQTDERNPLLVVRIKHYNR